MRIFTRYILREVVAYALLGGLLFTFVLFMRDLPKILDLVVRDSASLSDILRIFADLLPSTLTFTIPTAVLAGILLGLNLRTMRNSARSLENGRSDSSHSAML